MLTKNDHLYLIDGSGYIFRAYHALPPLTRQSDGLPVGAVSGFCNMLTKLLDETQASHLAVIFDAAGKSFRNDIYPDYKAHRPDAPEDLVPQFSLIREAVRAFGLPAIELKGFEADDLIATYARAAQAAGARVTIISSDKDLMQLVGDNIDMLDTMKNRQIGVAEVVEKFGVASEKVVDVQALAGDSVDNVPGVPGIGIKTAAQLIDAFGDLDTLLARAGEIKQNKRRENLIEFAEQARISRDLVRLRTDAPMPCDFAAMHFTPPDGTRLISFLKAMEFNTITKRMAARFEIDMDAVAPDENLRAQDTKDDDDSVSGDGLPPLSLPDMPPIDAQNYHCITTMAQLDDFIADAYATGLLAIDTETDGLDTQQCKLVGISLATRAGYAGYIPLAHGKGDGLALEDVPAQLELDDVVAALSPVLCDAAVLKILQNAKFDMHILYRHNIEHIAPFDDTMLMSYALHAGLHGAGMDILAQKFLKHEPIPIKDLLGSGKKQITFDQVPLAHATAYAAEDADITLRLWYCFKPLLREKQVTRVYATTERPLVPVLAAMERRGVKVDRDILAQLSGKFAQQMAAMEDEIYQLAGERFNIASPKQLGEILFDKMGLVGSKKTKSGARGTGADVLENLAAEGHVLPARVLAWRGLAKLKSTYTDALPEFINPATGRVHTSYSLVGATTGRLSSTEPNLQNIPIRTADGRKIRTAFIAEAGNLLVSADYSQIELRILADIADIASLKQAFLDGLDIHAMTASEIFRVPLDDMTPEIRRRAKAINFGIIYGISAFGLARQLDISRGEAGDYIKSYFERFPGIRDYMEDTKKRAHEDGFVKTLFGRKIHIRDIASKNAAQRAFSERAAINAPIQGSAADIIRRAMIRIPDALDASGLKAQMLLQIHDELIFEVVQAQAAELITVVKQIMEKAHLPALPLSVPLIIDANSASNWDEAH